MSSHVHIGLYDALREAGASEEKALAGAVDSTLPAKSSPPRKTCCEQSAK